MVTIRPEHQRTTLIPYLGLGGYTGTSRRRYRGHRLGWPTPGDLVDRRRRQATPRVRGIAKRRLQAPQKTAAEASPCLFSFFI